ncbi:MAG TPA: hypothetical protein VN870_06970, partial [Streptosporangiaceae bacterium]|nr:hypothetical protein [Streptosporangiaceae bacterium]
ATVRDAARAIIRINYIDIADEFGRVDETECWRRLREVLAENLGVPTETIDSTTSFADFD